MTDDFVKVYVRDSLLEIQSERWAVVSALLGQAVA